MNKLNVLILAAGEGTRMKSALPKVLHNAGGKPMLWYVYKAAKSIHPDSIAVVAGFNARQVEDEVHAWDSNTVIIRQKKLRGTADAVNSAADTILTRFRKIVILCGDTPLIEGKMLKNLVRIHNKNHNTATVLGTRMDFPCGYGRLKISGNGNLIKIIEEKDANRDEREIKLVNTGVYCFETAKLLKALPLVRSQNKKGEYYLTDVIELLNRQEERVGVAHCNNPEVCTGVNTRKDLAKVETILRSRVTDRLMANGVTIIDPATTYIAPDVKIGRDTVIMPCTVIGEGTVIGTSCQIGPFCRIRPGTRIASRVKIGNFTEIKNSVIKNGSKVPHLSYIGDSVLGQAVNIGAGTITCNYDGSKKHKTVIGNGAFVGSNVNFVAPVKIGDSAVIGAGSTITENVPKYALAIARSRQVNKPGWVSQLKQHEKGSETHGNKP